jgi:hypothetical protein
MMDKKTVEKISGRITEVSVHISRKVTDGNYGSYEVQFGETRSVAPDVDSAVVYREMYAGVSGKIDAAVEKFQGELCNTEEKPTTIKNAPPPKEKKLPAPEVETRTAIDDAGNELEKVPVDSIEILFAKSGNKYGRIKGGKWVKSGIAVFGRTLAEAPLEWDIDTLDVGEYDVPEGLTALIKMGVYQGKPSPDSVVGWA